MKLSIVTINYNNIDGLKKTVNSVMSQTLRDFEWIIIDGGSTDGSKDVIANLAKNPASNIRYWCSEKDKGIYNAMNKGVMHCMGEYICCMNSGDVFYDENTLLQVFSKEYKADILYGDWIRVYEDREELNKAPSVLGIYELYKNNISQQAMFVSTTLLKDEGFDESYHILADYKRWIDAMHIGTTFEYVNQIVCKFDTTGISSTQKTLIKEESLRISHSFSPSLMSMLIKYDGVRKDYLENPCVIKTKNISDKGGIRLFFLRLFLIILGEKL